MKKSILMGGVIIVAGAFLIMIAFLVWSAKAPTTIKIGWPSPLTGPLASFGEPDPWIAKLIMKKINDEQGGLYMSTYGKKIPIEIILRDTKSDEKTASDVATSLVVDDKVDLIVVLHTPATTVPVSAVCEKYHVPCVAADTPVLAWLSGAPYNWSYLHFWTEPDLGEMYVSMWDTLPTNKKVGGLWNDDSDGKSIKAAVLAAAERHGYQVVGDEGLSPYSQQDYSSYINDWKQKGVDIVTGMFIPPNFAKLRNQMNTFNYQPRIVTIAKAILFPASVEELGGDLPQGLSTEVWMDPSGPGVSTVTGLTNAEFAHLWEKESGKQWTQPVFFSEGAFEIALDALKRAGTVDKEAVKTAVADTSLDTSIGHVSFKTPLSADQQERYAAWPELAANKSHYSIAPVVGGQWAHSTDKPWHIEVVYDWKYPDIPVVHPLVSMPSK